MSRNFTCPICKETKPESDFPKSRGKGKLTKPRPRRCCTCRNKADRQKQMLWRHRNPEKVRKQQEVQNNSRRDRYSTDVNYRDLNRKACKKYREENREKLQKRQRDGRRNIRKKVIDMYGGRCVCCGESTFEFLTIDHKNGGGAKHRRKVGANRIIYDLLRIGAPQPEFQILCYNCNCAKGFYGVCPHQKSSTLISDFVRE